MHYHDVGSAQKGVVCKNAYPLQRSVKFLSILKFRRYTTFLPSSHLSSVSMQFMPRNNGVERSDQHGSYNTIIIPLLLLGIHKCARSMNVPVLEIIIDREALVNVGNVHGIGSG